MVNVTIKLTTEQMQQVQPIYDVLNTMADSGAMGITIGQLRETGGWLTTGWFSHASFGVFDHEATERIVAVVKQEISRMNSKKGVQHGIIDND